MNNSNNIIVLLLGRFRSAASEAVSRYMYLPSGSVVGGDAATATARGEDGPPVFIMAGSRTSNGKGSIINVQQLHTCKLRTRQGGRPCKGRRASYT